MLAGHFPKCLAFSQIKESSKFEIVHYFAVTVKLLGMCFVPNKYNKAFPAKKQGKKMEVFFWDISENEEFSGSVNKQTMWSSPIL